MGIKILILIDIPVGMYMHSIFHFCSVITVTNNIYIFDTLGYRFQLSFSKCIEFDFHSYCIGLMMAL
jgi:hypothetical protein